MPLHFRVVYAITFLSDHTCVEDLWNFLKIVPQVSFNFKNKIVTYVK